MARKCPGSRTTPVKTKAESIPELVANYISVAGLSPTIMHLLLSVMLWSLQICPTANGLGFPMITWSISSLDIPFAFLEALIQVRTGSKTGPQEGQYLPFRLAFLSALVHNNLQLGFSYKKSVAIQSLS